MVNELGKLLEKGVSFLVRFCGGIAAVMIFGMSILIAYDAFARYFGHPTIWVGEISTYLLVWVSFVGAAYGLEAGSHFRVTLLFDRLPEKRQKQLEIILFSAGLLFCIFLFKGSLDVMLRSLRFGGRSMTPIRAPLVYPQMAVPLGAFCLGVQLLKMIIADILAVKRLPSPNAKTTEFGR